MNTQQLLDNGFNTVGKHVHTVKSRIQLFNNLEGGLLNKCKDFSPCTLEEKGGALKLLPNSSTSIMVVDHDKKTTSLEEKGGALMLLPNSSVMEVAHDKKTISLDAILFMFLLYILFLIRVAKEEKVLELEVKATTLKAEKLEVCPLIIEKEVASLSHDKNPSPCKHSKQEKKQMLGVLKVSIYDSVFKKRSYKWEC